MNEQITCMCGETYFYPACFVLHYQKCREVSRAQGGEAVDFGQGRWTVEVGEYGKQPAVFVAPAITPGVSGDLSEPTTGADKHRLVPGEWVMTFPTEGQAFEVADALTRRRIKRLNGTRPDDDHSAPRHQNGWRLVPETPTGPMLDAWFSADRLGDPEDTNWYPAYRAMIEASPNPPEQESE